jgi:hypothetical protein
MTVAHTGRAHSRIGPSAAHRWIACPGSVRASAHIENASSYFALEGTAAHELCEHIMTTGVDPNVYLDGVIDLGPSDREREDLEVLGDVVEVTPFRRELPGNPQPDGVRYWRIDEEMIEGVEMYRDTLMPLIGDHEMDVVEFECRLDMRHIHPEFFGTGDALIYRHDMRKLIVGDFKFGSGIVVEVEDNEQLLSYAVGALHRFGNYPIDEIELIVIQPRAWHKLGPVRRHTITIDELRTFEAKLKVYADATDDPNASFLAGDHCRFCPIAHACRALRVHVYKAIGVKFVGNDINDSAMPNIDRMTPDHMGRVYREAIVIEAWFRRFFEAAHKQAVNGKIPTGCKLVEKRAYRKFKDPLDVEAVCDLIGVSEEEMHTEPKLKSVNQLETLVGKKTFKKFFAGMWTKVSSGVVLALAEDDRDSVKLDKSEAFGAVDDEEDV